MGFEKSTGATEYDLNIFLTPLGEEKFYSGGLFDSLVKFSISDADANYLLFTNVDYTYDKETGGILLNNSEEVRLGHSLNLRGTVDRNNIIEDRMLSTNLQSMRNLVWKNSEEDVFLNSSLAIYKLSEGNKYFDKPIILGGRNMWHKALSSAINNDEGFLYYIPPTKAREDYIDVIEPIKGSVSIGATDYVPYPGVNVTDPRRSFTEIQNFYVTNASNKSMYLDTLLLKDVFPVTHTVGTAFIDMEYSSEFVKVTYVLNWKALKGGEYYKDGAINIFIPQAIYNRGKLMLYPYEVACFGVSFEILTPGSAVIHWHGQTYSNPTINEGQYNFTIGLTAKLQPNPVSDKLLLAVVPKRALYSGTYDYITEIKIIAKVKSYKYYYATYELPNHLEQNNVM